MNYDKNDQNKTKTIRQVLVIDLLKTFTEEELNYFDEYINCTYFNSNKNLCKLLQQLRRYALCTETFSEAIQLKVYQQVSGKASQQFSLNLAQKKILNKLLNSLLVLAEDFLVTKCLKTKKDKKYELLFPELIERKQMVLYKRRLNAFEKKLNNEIKQGVEYHNRCYNVQQEKAKLSFINNVLAKEDNYDELQYHADVKYLLQKLQYHLAKITIQRRYVYKIFNHKPFAALQTLLKLPEYESNPLIQLYVLNIQLVEKEEKATFLSLSKLLKEKQAVIPIDFLKPFYTNLTNYCTYQLAKGDFTYYQYLFNIYNDMDEGELLVVDKLIELALLKNMITTACRVNNFDWATEKLIIYINYVSRTIRQSVFEYNQGVIAFNQQKYDLALTHFKKVRKIDDTHDLSLRIVQLQSFYETDTIYETSTQQLLDSLKAFIQQNKKLAKRQKTAYFNFIRIFFKLYKFKDIPDKRGRKIAMEKQLPKLKANLLKFDFIILKQWLLNKIEVLQEFV